MSNDKPKLGLLGIMLEAYEEFFPGITERQEKFARSVVNDLEEVADISFPKAAKTRNDIETIVNEFNEKDFDGIILLMLTYGPSMLTVRAFKENDLPLLLACIQPSQTAGTDWGEPELTYNQGIHGAQDLANNLMRSGHNYEVIVENRFNEHFKNFVGDWAKVARTIHYLKSMKIAQFGKLHNMGDILFDYAAFQRKLGPQVNLESIGLVYDYIQELSEQEINNQLEKDKEVFEIDPELDKETHKYAASLYLGFKKFLVQNDYPVFTSHFDVFQEDGIFEQLPFLAASNLMAEGYGYAAEGDVLTALLVKMGHLLAGDAHFTEMYTMDYERKAILLSHAGESNWKIARTDRPIKLIDRVMQEGGLANPPTPIFLPESGPGTLASLVPVSGEKFKLVVTEGEILDEGGLTKVEMPYFFFRPDQGIRKCIDNWLRIGATHHEILNLGYQADKWRMIANMLDIEYEKV